MSNKKCTDKYFYFERIAITSPREVALAMLGFDYDLEDSELEDEDLEEVNRLKRAIARRLQTITTRAGSNTNYPAHEVLAAAYVFQRDDVYPTPKEVRGMIINAVQKFTTFKGWKEKLISLGGDELFELGKRLKHSNRGLHKRDDEYRNNNKLIALLVELLQKNGKSSYKELSVIYMDITSLCKERGVSIDGIKNASFYKKVKDAKDILYFDTE